jgi:CheY-like chemotaxis protein
MSPGKRLLIVEDNNIAREGLTLLLRREGYEVVQAADGEQALACLRSGPRPDLILLDMLLPVLDGWHFLQQIQAEHVPAIPIIVVTSTVLSRQWAEDSRLLWVCQEVIPRIL